MVEGRTNGKFHSSFRKGKKINRSGVHSSIPHIFKCMQSCNDVCLPWNKISSQMGFNGHILSEEIHKYHDSLVQNMQYLYPCKFYFSFPKSYWRSDLSFSNKYKSNLVILLSLLYHLRPISFHRVFKFFSLKAISIIWQPH